MGGSSGPIRSIWHGKSGRVLDRCWDQHGLVSWQHSLADGNFVTCLVDSLEVSNTIHTVRLIRERLRDGSIIIALEPTILWRLVSQSVPRTRGVDQLTIDNG